MKQHVQSELAVVMPVFNEEASVRKIVRQWFEEILALDRVGSVMNKGDA